MQLGLPLHNALRNGHVQAVHVLRQAMDREGCSDLIEPNPTKIGHDHDNLLLLPLTFKAGDRICLHGLTKEEYNGQAGTCREERTGKDGTSRYAVLLDESKKAVSFSVKNIVPNEAPRAADQITEKEAEVFQLFAGTLRDTTRAVSGESLRTIEQAIRHALSIEEECAVNARISGSRKKGTETTGSDVDIVITTPTREISPADRKAVVKQLQDSQDFRREHVCLKKHAIFCHVPCSAGTHSIPADLVFHDETWSPSESEYGELSQVGTHSDYYGVLPGNAEERFKDNRAAQEAARVLKVAMQNSTSLIKPLCTSLPSYIFELVVIEAQTLQWAANETSHAGNDDAAGNRRASLILFCDTLQLLADSNAGNVLDEIQKKWCKSSEPLDISQLFQQKYSGVDQFLVEKGLDFAVDSFVSHKITFDDIDDDFTDQTLVDMGIRTVGERKQVLRAVTKAITTTREATNTVQ